ncbi:Flp family type IVb pilin [Roseomonas sp. HJA6]|uniref:Flp family type IVb pilin n=1 Tax=Roseomonas alba TaxID=2846776 RepID=A0ABS7A3C2_9PROT|nr:Flp family type IVb pilin [Neoroseomonas alba]MBW6396802.1 Flp family type IVb pilin [Neoroseomonas alba]
MIRKFLASLHLAVVDRKGVTAAEYAVLAVGIVIVVAAAAATFGTKLSDVFTALGSRITVPPAGG